MDDFERTCNIVIEGVDSEVISDFVNNLIEKIPKTDNSDLSKNVFITSNGIKIVGQKSEGICNFCARFEKLIKPVVSRTCRENKTKGYVDFGFCVQKNEQYDFSESGKEDRQNLVNLFMNK